MASKEFEKFLANASDEQKKNITDLGKAVDSKIESTIKSTNINDITQHSTPNDRLGYGDTVKTPAPTDKAEATTPVKGNSSSMNHVQSQPTTATTPQQTQSDKLTQ